MKKGLLYIAIPLALMAALALVLALTPQRENLYFGGVAEVYSPNDSVELDAVGATHLLEPLCVRPRSHLYVPQVEFAVGDMQLILTGWVYRDGTPDFGSDSTTNRFGFIEKRDEHGEWRFYDSLRYERLSGFAPYGSDCPVAEAGSSFDIGVCLPADEHGEYRVTYWFRECLDADALTTGDELYSVSHTFTVADAAPTDDVFTVRGVELIDGGTSHTVRVALADGLLFDHGSAELETLENGRWIPAEVNVDGGSGKPYDRRPMDVGAPPFSGASLDALRSTPYIEIPAASPSREYRLTLEFSRKGGDTMPLTLYLNFSAP